MNKDDFNIDDPDDKAKLRYIFKRISKMELENYDEVHDKIEPSVIQYKEIKDANMTRYSEYKSKYKKKKNKTNESTKPKYVLYNRGEKDRYSKPYLNPTLDLQYQKRKDELIDAYAKHNEKRFLSGNDCYCIHQNTLKQPDEYIKFEVDKDGTPSLDVLMTDASQLGTGIAKEMVNFMKSKYHKLRTVPHGTNAKKFWDGMGFKYGTWTKSTNKLTNTKTNS